MKTKESAIPSISALSYVGKPAISSPPFALDSPFVLKPVFVQLFKQLEQKYNPIVHKQYNQTPFQCQAY